MKRHLNKINKCRKNNDVSDEELYNKSLEKHEDLNICSNINNNSSNNSFNNFNNNFSNNYSTDINNDNYICTKCNKLFSNKGNLNKHIKLVCQKNVGNITNIQNIGVQNITNKIININLNMIKGFDQDWDTTDIDHKKKGEILLSNSKFTKTLENILKNNINLNVVMNEEDDKTGMVYIDQKKNYELITKEEIIDCSMKKVYNHLKDFYNEIINNNKDDLSIKSLENELKIFEEKYRDFLNFEDAKNIVNNAFSKLYNKKKDEAESIYNNFIDNNNNKSIEEY